jgi:hypothetical protein
MVYHAGMDPAYTVRTERVSSEIIENEALLIDLESGNYFTTTGLGCFVWQMLGAGYSVDRICREVSDRISRSFQAVTEEVRDFIGDLEGQSLIRPIADPPKPGGLALDWDSLEDPGPPVLEKYTDMRELLLIDPIHEVDEQGWPIKADPEAPV